MRISRDIEDQAQSGLTYSKRNWRAGGLLLLTSADAVYCAGLLTHCGALETWKCVGSPSEYSGVASVFDLEYFGIYF